MGHGFQRQKNEKLTTRGEKNNKKQGWTCAINNLPVYLGRALCAYSCSVALLEASSISVASGFGQKYQHLSTRVLCGGADTEVCRGSGPAQHWEAGNDQRADRSPQLVSAMQRALAGNAEGRFAAQASPAGWVEMG